MAIRRKYGAQAELQAAAIAGAGKAQTEKALRAIEAEDRRIAQANAVALRLEEQARAQRHAFAMAEFTAEMSLEREKRTVTRELEAEERAYALKLDLMEARDRIDFEREETERQQELDRVDAKILAIEKAREDGLFTGKEFEYEDMLLRLQAQKFGVKGQIRTLDPQQRLMYSLMQERTTGAAPAPVGTTAVAGPSDLLAPTVDTLTTRHVEALNAVGRTYLVRKATNELVEVPIESASASVATGRFKYPIIVDIMGQAQEREQRTIEQEQRKRRVIEQSRARATTPRTAIYGIR